MERIEFGGGYKKRDGFHNFDIDPEWGDTIINLEETPYPIASDSVSEFYSSHCLEHVANLFPLLRELLRICHVGAKLEIRVPHFTHMYAFVPTEPCHKHCLSDRWFRDLAEFPERWLSRDPASKKFCHGKVFALSRIHYEPDELFADYRRQATFRGLSDDFILRLMPGATHEIHAHLEVTSWT